MTRSNRAAIAISYMALLLSTQSDAQTFDPQTSANQLLMRRIQAGATLQRYLQSLRAEIRRLDANGDGAVDLADAEIHDAIAAATYRAGASMRFMSADFDGDGAVNPTAEGGAKNTQAGTATGNLETVFRWLTPGGLIELDTKSVVASGTAQPYEVAPQEAGLIQLMKSGALTQNQRGEFLIHSKMRFPAALSGRHAARFLLMRGVPMPEGDPGNSVVIAEETGEAIDKRH